ncbi:hypothetical protein D3C81_1920700 [compost metagenome]
MSPTLQLCDISTVIQIIYCHTYQARIFSSYNITSFISDNGFKRLLTQHPVQLLLIQSNHQHAAGSLVLERYLTNQA